jgi:hypothetical protein
LPRTPRRRAWSAGRTSAGRGRWSQSWSAQSHRTATGRLPGWMHRAARSGTHRRTLSGLWLSHCGTSLENGLPTYRHAAAWTLSGLRRALRTHRRCGTHLLRRRSVNRPWSSLRRNQAPHRSNRCLRALLLRCIRDRSGRRGGWRLSRRRCDLHRSRSLQSLNGSRTGQRHGSRGHGGSILSFGGFRHWSLRCNWGRRRHSK